MTIDDEVAAASGKAVGGLQAPSLFERVLALAAIALLCLVATALLRGIGDMGKVTPVIWAHLATVVLAVALAPIQLLRKRGDPIHRLIGRIWASLLFVTAIISFGIRDINHGSLSGIHILSALTILSVPTMVWAARTGRIRMHQGFARGLIAGALLIAGFFTLLPSRILGGWLFG